MYMCMYVFFWKQKFICVLAVCWFSMLFNGQNRRSLTAKFKKVTSTGAQKLSSTELSPVNRLPFFAFGVIVFVSTVIFVNFGDFLMRKISKNGQNAIRTVSKIILFACLKRRDLLYSPTKQPTINANHLSNIHLTIYLSIYLSIQATTYLLIYSIIQHTLSIHISIYFNLSTHPIIDTYPSTSSIHWFICLYLYPFIYYFRFNYMLFIQ